MRTDQIRKREPVLRPALVTLAVLLAYANSVDGPLILDDRITILENQQIRSTRLSEILSPERELPVAGRPLVNASFALNFALGGLDVTGYHVVNVALHAACALLFYGLVKRALVLPRMPPPLADSAPDLAMFAALLWGVHPLNSEAVNYVTQRTELMMAFCYLLTLYSSVRGWNAAAVLACAAGMACKESMVTAPVMTALVDAALVFGSISLALRARWRFYLCLAATWGILAALLSTGPRVHSAGLSSGVSPWTYLLNQPDIILDYLKHTVWPTGLVALYGWPVDLTIGQVWLPGLIVVLLLAVTVLAMVKQPRLGLLGAWFFITLAPASSLVPIATEAGAERRMYLPLMAIAVLAVIGLWRTLTARIPGRDRRVWLVVAPLVIALGATTVVRHRDYDSELRLAQTSFDARPNDLARHFLGVALVAEGRRDEGLAMLRQATATNPRAWFDLGRAYYEGKQLDESVAALEEFARRQPDLLEVVDARLLICRVFTHRKEWVRAIEQCREVLRMAPSSGEARQLLGSALTGHGINFVAEGKLAEATDMFRQVVAMDPANPDAHRNLAVVYFDRGEMPQAAQHARLGLELRADDAVMLDVLRQTQLPGSQR